MMVMITKKIVVDSRFVFSIINAQHHQQRQRYRHRNRHQHQSQRMLCTRHRVSHVFVQLLFAVWLLLISQVNPASTATPPIKDSVVSILDDYHNHKQIQATTQTTKTTSTTLTLITNTITPTAHNLNHPHNQAEAAKAAVLESNERRMKFFRMSTNNKIAQTIGVNANKHAGGSDEGTDTSFLANDIDYIGTTSSRQNDTHVQFNRLFLNFSSATDFDIYSSGQGAHHRHNMQHTVGANETTSSTHNVINLVKQSNNYWALALLLIPVATIFGNILVVLAVVREKNLHNVTNYFVVSLAIADLTVAATVIPFAVYSEVTNGKWLMSNALCDAWVATDVMASTASILNLVAIAIDRFIAVTKPLKYAQHRASKRVQYTIIFLWLISIAIALPIVAGFNDTPDRVADICTFYNETFQIYSSIFSFYIPTIVMLVLYYRIFRVIRSRAAKKKTTAKANLMSLKRIQTNEAAEKAKPTAAAMARASLVVEAVATSSTLPKTITSTLKRGGDDPAMACMLYSANVDFKEDVFRSSSSDQRLNVPSTNTNTNTNNHAETSYTIHSSANSDSNLNNEDASIKLLEHSTISNNSSKKSNININVNNNNNNNNNNNKDSCKSSNNGTSKEEKANNNQRSSSQKASDSTGKAVPKTNVGTKPFNKSSSSMPSSSSNKERKVTKTLAIVLIVFLVCWFPFFSVNILKGICKQFHIQCGFIKDEYIGVLAWLGYLNSLLNPIIYTTFNIEFRRGFERILSDTCCKKRQSSR